MRQHLRSVLRRQLSQKRAEERKQAEEQRRLYNEEEEILDEEVEMSDGETTGGLLLPGKVHVPCKGGSPSMWLTQPRKV